MSQQKSASRQYTRMEDALERLGREHEPPPGWEARVLAQVQARPPWWTRWTVWLTIPAVVLVVLVFALWPEHPPRNLQLALDVTATGSIARGSSAHIGDRVTATAAGGERYHAIWVYRDDELIAVCPGSSLCEISGDFARARIALGAYGTYTFVALSHARPIPPAHGSYDLDLVTAGDAGMTSQVQRISVN
jgi:hypothetical protein